MEIFPPNACTPTIQHEHAHACEQDNVCGDDVAYAETKGQPLPCLLSAVGTGGYVHVSLHIKQTVASLAQFFLARFNLTLILNTESSWKNKMHVSIHYCVVSVLLQNHICFVLT